MSPDALDMLVLIEKFLKSSVADQVPAALRSEVRAAAKSLGDAREQLDAAFPLLMRECDELRDLVQSARDALGQSAAQVGNVGQPQSLSALKEQHMALQQDLGDLVLLLQQRGDGAGNAALVRIFTTLRKQAGSRFEWQSVFPPDTLVSDVLRGTWPNGNS